MYYNKYVIKNKRIEMEDIFDFEYNSLYLESMFYNKINNYNKKQKRIKNVNNANRIKS